MSDFHDKMQKIRDEAIINEQKKQAQIKGFSEQIRQNVEWLYPIFQTVSNDFVKEDTRLNLKKGLISNAPCFKVTFGKHMLHISGSGSPNSVDINSTTNAQKLYQNTLYNGKPDEEQVKSALEKRLLSWYDSVVKNRL
jgi:hypothetical protein